MPVEVDRGIDLLHDGVGPRRKASAPHLVARFFSHQVSPIMPPSNDRSFAIKRLALVLLGGVVGVAVGLAGIYGIARLTSNPVLQAECRPAAETAKRLAPLARGEVA